MSATLGEVSASAGACIFAAKRMTGFTARGHPLPSRHTFDKAFATRGRGGTPVTSIGILVKPTASCLFLCLILFTAVIGAVEPLDVLTMGEGASEAAHDAMTGGSEIITGGLGQAARRLLPLVPNTWEGGRLAFTLRVDAVLPTYVTLRLWGGDVSHNRLLLYVDGKQIGYRHLGDIDILDTGSAEPACPGRFFYVTTPLPTTLTRGRTSVACEIRSSGRIWGYGTTFEQYQKPMTQPTRGIYRVYSHTDGCFVPPADERQGHLPAAPPLRTTPGVEMLEQVRQRVGKELTGLLTAKRPLNQMQLHLLARAWSVAWTPAHRDPRVVSQLVASVDGYHVRFREDRTRTRADPSTWNPEWYGVGPAADAVRLLASELASHLEQPMPGVPGMTRRAAWAELFQDSRDWLRTHRRQYTNQAMICDLNLYRSNSGLRVVAPAQALPEAQALRYLHEAVGLVPWLGSDTPSGPAKPLGERFLQLTAKGLTRELGYVGYYGEVLDWIIQILDATRHAGGDGDPAIRGQLARAAAARASFRYPAHDADGNRAMRIEAVIGWRDDHFPGSVTYGMRAARDASAIALAGVLRDATSLGHAQQMFADGQFFASLQAQMTEGGLRVTSSLLDVPEHFAWVQQQAASGRRLPLTSGQPDHVFTDEDDGVVVLKRGDEVLFVSLYWRARPAVNFLARVHHLTPAFERIAVVRQETRFTPSGQVWKRPDWVNMGFANGGHRYPGDLHSAHTGEELPIAKVPDGMAFKPGQENLYAGRGTFYRLVYGDYLIAMNMGEVEPQRLDWPAGLGAATDLVSGRTLRPDAQGGVMLAPHSTVVLVVARKP